jgi:hypothetical protein
MRQLKFRVWDTRDNEFVYIDDLYWFEENFIHNSEDASASIQQYTGIKDCNEIEIYEGDLVSFKVNTFSEIVLFENEEVKYLDEYAMFVFGKDEYCLNDYIIRESIEVTGNIYE